jgi:hypothetical protein
MMLKVVKMVKRSKSRPNKMMITWNRAKQFKKKLNCSVTESQIFMTSMIQLRSMKGSMKLFKHRYQAQFV